MHGDLRVVRACLDGNIAATELADELVSRKLWQILQLGRTCGGKAKALVKERGAKADGEREVRRLQVVGLAGILRDGVLADLGDILIDGGLALRHAPRHGGPRAQELLEFRAVLCYDVERREVKTVLLRRDDAGLVRAVELYGSRGGRDSVPAGTIGACRDRPCGEQTSPAEERATAKGTTHG